MAHYISKIASALQYEVIWDVLCQQYLIFKGMLVNPFLSKTNFYQTVNYGC